MDVDKSQKLITTTSRLGEFLDFFRLDNAPATGSLYVQLKHVRGTLNLYNVFTNDFL